jgi:hypothetical protein
MATHLAESGRSASSGRTDFGGGAITTITDETEWLTKGRDALFMSDVALRLQQEER